ncbi:MAG: hydrogenase 4 subunit F [Candidatus Pacebacteria bacterium]|nr:hydrogenase 4 subunit F [Candidatus Paceibacterota bacterium]
MTLTYLLIIPLVSALISLACTTKRLRVIEGVGVLAGIAEFWLAVHTLLYGVGEGGLTGLLALDAFGTLLVLIITFVGLASAVYSVGYLRVEREKGIVSAKRTVQFWVLFHLFIFAMLLSVVARHPIVMWAAIEATTLSTVFLVSFYKKESSLEAGWKYLVVNSVGLLIGFFGTLTLLSLAGSAHGGLLSWQDFATVATTFDPLAVKVAFIFILIGYGTKAGLVPMHTWLPDAHGKAPAPVSALLSGVLLNTAFLAIVRYKVVVDTAVDPSWSSHILLAFGVLSIVLMGCMLLVQRKYKRMLAYSSIENMGILAVGFGLGGVAVFYAMLHMVYHALVKSALFLTSGNLFLTYGSGKVKNVRGMLKTLPWSAPLFFLGLFGIVGVPPFGTFISKLGILTESMGAYATLAPVLLLAFALVFIGFLTHGTLMLFGTTPHETPDGTPVVVGERGILTVLPIVVLLATAILLSAYLPTPLRQTIENATAVYTR